MTGRYGQGCYTHTHNHTNTQTPAGLCIRGQSKTQSEAVHCICSLGMSVYSRSRDNTHNPPFPTRNNVLIYVCRHAYACFGSCFCLNTYMSCVCARPASVSPDSVCLDWRFHTEPSTNTHFTWETALSGDVGEDGSATYDLADQQKGATAPSC